MAKSVFGSQLASQPSRKACLMLLTLAALSVSACSKKPGGQVVAVVNNEDITQQELQAEAVSAHIPANADKQSATAALLQRVINRTVLADYARSQGLDRGPEYVARRRLLEQTLLADLAMKKLAGTQSAPTAAAVQTFVASHPTMFAGREQLILDQVQFATPADKAKLKELTGMPNIEAVVQQLRSDGTKFVRSAPTLDTASLDPSVAKQIIVLKNNEVFDISGNGQTFISVITARNDVALSPDAWSTAAENALKRDQAMKSISDSVSKLRKDAKIQYDPAFKPKGS